MRLSPRTLALVLPIAAALIAIPSACGSSHSTSLPDNFGDGGHGDGDDNLDGLNDGVDDLGDAGLDNTDEVGDDTNLGDPLGADDGGDLGVEEPGLPVSVVDPEEDPGADGGDPNGGDPDLMDPLGEDPNPGPEDQGDPPPDETVGPDAPPDTNSDCTSDSTLEQGTTTAPSGIAGNLANPPYWTNSWDCPKIPLGGTCKCTGSMYNCQLPNPQPGRNRYLPPAAIKLLNQAKGGTLRALIATRIGRWPVASSAKLYDGRGSLIGNGSFTSQCWTISGSGTSYSFNKVDTGHQCVRFNWGQVRVMKVPGTSVAVRFVLAYAVTARGRQTNGWIKLSSITDSNYRLYRMSSTAPQQYSTTSYVLKSAEDFGCTSDAYTPETCLPSWANLAVRPETAKNRGVRVREFMLKKGNFLDLHYSTPLVGGVASDTFGVAQDSILFRRAKQTDTNHRTVVRIGLYTPGTTTRVNSMYFVYGTIRGRWGWVPLAAIKQGTVKKAAVCALDGCGDTQVAGNYCSGYSPDGTYSCSATGVMTPGPSCLSGQTCAPAGSTPPDVSCASTSNFCTGSPEGFHCDTSLNAGVECRGGMLQQISQCSGGTTCTETAGNNFVCQ